MKIDLHIHTSFSDGVFPPRKIVDCAKDAGLGAIAITDHDNVLSWGEANEYAKENGIELIPGVEINTLYKGYEVHILGYFMDINNSDFQKLIKTQQQARIKQTKEILNTTQDKIIKLLGADSNIFIKGENSEVATNLSHALRDIVDVSKNVFFKEDIYQHLLLVLPVLQVLILLFFSI